jgi:peptide/nickel transport system substrate-binding protein
MLKGNGPTTVAWRGADGARRALRRTLPLFAARRVFRKRRSIVTRIEARQTGIALWERGLHRRTLLKSAAAAGLLSLVPAAARVNAQDEETTFRFVVISAAPDTIDPGENWNGAGGFVINAHVYDALFRFEGADTANIVPLLAVEVPTVENGGISEDGLQYTIKLKPEAKFPDGSPVNADAVKFSYDRTKALKLGVDFLLDQIEEMEAVDDTTVRFTIKQPFSPFLNSLGSVFANLVMNPAVVEANATADDPHAHNYFIGHAAGSGPYLLESYEPELGQATLLRNLDWWQGWPDGPHLDKVVVQYIQENATARLMLEQGDADYLAGITAEAMDALESMPGIVTFEGLSIAQSYIALNTHVAPFDNVKVRQALAYALNYDAIIEGVWGGGQKMDSVTPPMVGYAPAATKYTFDLEKAKQLLAEAGYPDGLDIEIAVDQGDEPASLTLQLYQADLAKIGVNLTITPMDANAMFAQHLNGDPAQALPAMFSYMGSDYPDAYQLLALTYGTRSLPPANCCNFSYYSNPKMDEIITRVETSLDPEERQAALQEGFDLAYEDESMIWLHIFADRAAMKDTVHGWEYNYVNGTAYVPYAKMSIG